MILCSIAGDDATAAGGAPRPRHRHDGRGCITRAHPQGEARPGPLFVSHPPSVQENTFSAENKCNIISKIKRALTTAAATTPDRAGDRGAGDGRAGANRGGGPRDGAAPLRGRSEHSNTNADRSRRRICAAATLRRFDRFSVAPEPSVKIRHQR